MLCMCGLEGSIFYSPRHRSGPRFRGPRRTARSHGQGGPTRVVYVGAVGVLTSGHSALGKNVWSPKENQCNNTSHFVAQLPY